MNESVIHTEGLSRWFDKKQAVAEIVLDVPRGAIFGFLGQNGAGKTTTIRMLMGHLHPSGGAVEIFGHDPRGMSRADRQRVAYISENMNLPRWMRPNEALALNASLYPNWDATRSRDLMNRFGLEDAGPFATLSKGQKRALCLVLALCTGAELLILDEPASGLDAAARRIFLDALLESNREKECTVFLSSHLLTDLERVVDRVAILKAGRKILDGELEELKDCARVLHLPASARRETVERQFRVASFRKVAEDVRATILDFNEDRLRALCAEDPAYGCVEMHGLNLEDLFVELVTGDRIETGGVVV
jgi:ABC-2 type transport system ATP-binding protein